MITTLCIAGYRSLRDIRLELDPINIVTGPNGSGKSSLYRSLRLLADVANGNIIRSLALEGGVQSVLWAGSLAYTAAMKRGAQRVVSGQQKKPVSLKLGFAMEDFGYAIDLGYPIAAGTSMFNYDPHIKTESLWYGQVLRQRNEIAYRNGPMVKVRDAHHTWQVVLSNLATFDSMMTHASAPTDARELLMVREAMRDWRFYDHFRSDRDSGARRPQIGTHTPVLDSDGHNLAAAVRTIIEIGDIAAFSTALDDAFPGASVDIREDGGYFELYMTQAGLFRPLRAAELSDGTLRYLLLIAALLSPRPPALMVLNEPEMSLHPDLLPALGRLIAASSKRSQIIVVSHAPELVAAIESAAQAKRIELYKEDGETLIADRDEPPWEWPSR
ncbi:AAA family ATPase [Asticcacaulis sp. YBE204]|uniref:AAA family ATPase n=1 Tax=Asticcacaulis sp. YBE204 TaxID=1282363 RepID=UPI0003C40DCF|nr:AAA family ATPase [Asticcacaulis sp. YBE204]ESQ80162.1 hypothetical protein AEYBE204_05965 [Asticcacaulis sp. YBE204]